MSRFVFYWVSVLFAVGLGYAIGFQHGSDKATLTAKRANTQVVVVPSPYGDVCDEMLEAAWSIQQVAPPAPHD